MIGLRKTSDKLLLAMALGAIVLQCCIYFSLHARFREGHIVTRRQLQEQGFSQYHMRQPAVLSLEGVVWANLYPSDSFYIELPKMDNPADKPWMTGQVGPEESIQLPTYRQAGDTLFITGTFADPLHRPFSDASYREHLPRVTIYGRGFKEIRLMNGQLVLDGGTHPAGGATIRLNAINSTVWVADNDEFTHTLRPKEFFDSLDIRSSNTFIIFNESADIRSATIHMDDNSELNDRWSTIGRIAIGGADSSHIGLTGNNLKHATIDIH